MAKPRRTVGEWKPAFLGALSKSANVKYSCEVAGVNRQHVYDAREQDEAFAAQWRDALDDAVDTLEEAARGRALKSSDLLMIFLLKAHRPDLYRETTRHELTGRNGEALIPIEALREALRRGTQGS